MLYRCVNKEFHNRSITEGQGEQGIRLPDDGTGKPLVDRIDKYLPNGPTGYRYLVAVQPAYRVIHTAKPCPVERLNRHID